MPPYPRFPRCVRPSTAAARGAVRLADRLAGLMDRLEPGGWHRSPGPGLGAPTICDARYWMRRLSAFGMSNWCRKPPPPSASRPAPRMRWKRVGRIAAWDGRAQLLQALPRIAGWAWLPTVPTAWAAGGQPAGGRLGSVRGVEEPRLRQTRSPVCTTRLGALARVHRRRPRSSPARAMTCSAPAKVGCARIGTTGWGCRCRKGRQRLRGSRHVGRRLLWLAGLPATAERQVADVVRGLSLTSARGRRPSRPVGQYKMLPVACVRAC